MRSRPRWRVLLGVLILASVATAGGGSLVNLSRSPSVGAAQNPGGSPPMLPGGLSGSVKSSGGGGSTGGLPPPGQKKNIRPGPTNRLPNLM